MNISKCTPNWNLSQTGNLIRVCQDNENEQSKFQTYQVAHWITKGTKLKMTELICPDHAKKRDKITKANNE